MLSLIAADFFAQSPVLVLPVVALILFFVVFLAIALRLILSSKEKLDELAQIPLQESNDHGPLT